MTPSNVIHRWNVIIAFNLDPAVNCFASGFIALNDSMIFSMAARLPCSTMNAPSVKTPGLDIYQSTSDGR